MTIAAWLWCACIATQLAALAGAIRIPRAPARDALALFVLFSIVADLAIAGGRALILDGAPRPFVGLARAWYHVETALVLAWPSGLALACARAFGWGERGWWRAPAPCVAAGSWSGVIVGLILAYPLGRVRTQLAITAHEVIAVGLAILAIVRGWRRPWSSPHAAMIVLVAIEIVMVLLGPFAHDLFRGWPTLGRVLCIMGFSAVAIVVTLGRRVLDRDG